jgi:hypothetical protein
LRQEDGGEIVGLHQEAGFLLTLGALDDGDGRGLLAQRAEGGDGWRQRLIVFGGVGERGQSDSGGGGEGTGLEKVTARKHGGS